MDQSHKTLDKLNKDERSLLLYIEHCQVDQRGMIDSRKVNDVDTEILERWHREGFIFYSRITFRCLERRQGPEAAYQTHIVRLSSEAWKLAHQERKARSARMQIVHPEQRIPAKEMPKQFLFKGEKIAIEEE